MTITQEQATTSCYERLEPSQPIEKPDLDSKVIKWNKRWVLSNILDRRQEHFILDDMKLTIIKYDNNQFQATLSYYITSKGWTTGTTEIPGIRIDINNKTGMFLSDWPIDNIQVSCGENHQYREHQTIFNIIVFENIFQAERDINNGRVYKC